MPHVQGKASDVDNTICVPVSILAYVGEGFLGDHLSCGEICGY